MDYNTTHWEGFGWITTQGGPQADRKTKLERMGRWMGVSHAVGQYGGGGITGGGDLRIPPPEHRHTVHCNQAHYGPVPGGRAEAEIRGNQSVVGAEIIGLGGDADGGSVGGTDGGGGGDGKYGDGDVFNWWEGTAANVLLGTEHNATLASAPGL